VDESALDHPVPTFSLQPLVENAVRHGIASRAEGGRIVIDAGFSAGGLRIEVTNDGAGREVEANGDEGGTGLRVLRDRLEALYGGRAEMTLGPSGEGEFRVVMTLPAEADSSGPAEEEA
jgi:LytS/YehU family sensor histidine kinase